MSLTLGLSLSGDLASNQQVHEGLGEGLLATRRLGQLGLALRDAETAESDTLLKGK
jgi:hypothetical protein